MPHTHQPSIVLPILPARDRISPNMQRMRDCTSACGGLDVHSVHVSMTDLQDLVSNSIQYRIGFTCGALLLHRFKQRNPPKNFLFSCDDPCGKRFPRH